jgi:hypothetical protein
MAILYEKYTNGESSMEGEEEIKEPTQEEISAHTYKMYLAITYLVEKAECNETDQLLKNEVLNFLGMIVNSIPQGDECQTMQ